MSETNEPDAHEALKIYPGYHDRQNVGDGESQL
jgi:hypothetical protein